MKKMYKEASNSVEKTTHSLRATGVTATFAAGVLERLVKSVTG